MKLSKKVANYMLESLIHHLYNLIASVSGGYFFIVIGDDKVSHVAWLNTENLALHGAMVIASNFESVSALETIQVGVDALTEEDNLSPEFKKDRDERCMDEIRDCWISIDNM